MDSKKILIVSRSFYPENSPRAFRTTELVKEFARQGHDVTLITPKREEVHSQFEREHGVSIKDLGRLWLQKISFGKSSGVLYMAERAVNRGLSLLIDYPDIELIWKVKKALKHESGYDLLISIAVPHTIHWGVAAARSFSTPIAKTWAADCGDPYMGQETDSFNKLFYFGYVEKWFCRKVDTITVPVENAKVAYYPEFRDKIHVIPQGFNFEDSAPDSGQYKSNPVPTFAYAGGLMPGSRDPRKFLQHLLEVGQPFKFILYTKNRAILEPYLEQSDGQIEIREYVPRRKLLEILSRMEFLINFENSTNVQQPSKLIDYYLAGRPVLSIDCRKPNMALLEKFLEGNYEDGYSFNEMEQYRIENVCRKFLEL